MQRKNFRNQSGQGLTEYAVVLSLVAVASIAGMGLFGGAIKGRVASLAGAVAGQNQRDIKKADKRSKDSAKEATDRASHVKGNTTINSDDTFDSMEF